MEYVSVTKYNGVKAFTNNYLCKSHKYAKKLFNKMLHKYQPRFRRNCFNNIDRGFVFLVKFTDMYVTTTGEDVDIVWKYQNEILPSFEVDELPF